jgi:hypothetical protein
MRGYLNEHKEISPTSLRMTRPMPTKKAARFMEIVRPFIGDIQSARA